MVGHAPDGRLDLAERASYISSTTKDKGTDGYANVKTPLEDIEGGALRAGGAPKLLSRQNIGVLCHYACIGILLASLPATIYPFLQVYLFVEGRVALTAETLVTLPWSLKVFYGLLSDCVPIFGNRRRPYMVIGWGTCILMLWIMAFMPVERGFWAEDAHTRLRAGTKEYEDAVAAGDPSAKEKGAKYVMMMMLAAVGYQMANVCADGVVCELAQREPLEVRGTTQSAIYATRMAASVFGRLLVGFLFNGERYGGAFDFSITFPTLMMILAIAMCPMVFVSWFFITESQSPRVNFREYLGDLWNLLQSRAVYQVIFYFFFSGVFSGISWTAESPVQRILIGVTPINNILSSVLATATLAIGVAVTGKYGLAWNWRKVIILTSLVIIAIDAFVTFISVWDVFRSQWFWLGVPLAVQVPNGINFVISTYVVVELAGIGNEGAMYGLLTTVSNLSSPFATTLTRIINANWDFSNKRIGEDSTELRWDITYVVLIMYASTLFSLVFLYWLPPQKAETQELKRNGGSSKLWGGVTLFYVSFALVWSIMVNIMGIYESTNCLLIAGGTGC